MNLKTDSLMCLPSIIRKPCPVCVIPTTKLDFTGLNWAGLRWGGLGWAELDWSEGYLNASYHLRTQVYLSRLIMWSVREITLITAPPGNKVTHVSEPLIDGVFHLVWRACDYGARQGGKVEALNPIEHKGTMKLAL